MRVPVVMPQLGETVSEGTPPRGGEPVGGGLTGTGPGGRITRDDVAAAVAHRDADAAPATAPAAATTAPASRPPVSTRPDAEGDHTQPLTRVRTVIAERMVASLQTSAQLTSVVEVDVPRIAQLRKRAGAGRAGVNCGQNLPSDDRLPGGDVDRCHRPADLEVEVRR